MPRPAPPRRGARVTWRGWGCSAPLLPAGLLRRVRGAGGAVPCRCHGRPCPASAPHGPARARGPLLSPHPTSRGPRRRQRAAAVAVRRGSGVSLPGNEYFSASETAPGGCHGSCCFGDCQSPKEKRGRDGPGSAQAAALPCPALRSPPRSSPAAFYLPDAPGWLCLQFRLCRGRWLEEAAPARPSSAFKRPLSAPRAEPAAPRPALEAGPRLGRSARVQRCSQARSCTEMRASNPPFPAGRHLSSGRRAPAQLVESLICLRDILSLPRPLIFNRIHPHLASSPVFFSLLNLSEETFLCCGELVKKPGGKNSWG